MRVASNLPLPPRANGHLTPSTITAFLAFIYIRSFSMGLIFLFPKSCNQQVIEKNNQGLKNERYYNLYLIA
jgi:hypothetical protein